MARREEGEVEDEPSSSGGESWKRDEEEQGKVSMYRGWVGRGG